MLCPFCLENISSGNKNCSNPDCGREIPALYKKHYPKGFGSKPPAIMSAVGFSGHGKTVYFAALLHVLDQELTKAWDGFFRQGLENLTVRTIKQNLELLERKELPESTRQNFPDPSIHRLVKIPGQKERLMVLYDTSGEAFEEDIRLEKYAHYVARSRVVLFFVSLSDLAAPLTNEMHRLLEVYTQGMAKLHGNPKNQHLVVVYSKADLLEERYFQDYPSILAHLNNSTYVEMGSYKDYVRRLVELSRLLDDFTRNKLESRAFVNLATTEFRTISYCAVSSLGSAPEGSKLRERMKPVRVADPLIWVLERS